MTQLKDSMSNIEKIRQEIERLKTTNPSEYNYNNAEGYIWAMDDILAFIDSLPEENLSYVTDSPGDPGHPGEPGISDLEQAAARYERENRQSVLASVDIVNAFIDSLPDEACKDSLQAQETCKENQDSFTDESKYLEEAANEYSEKHGFRVPYDGSNNFYDEVDVKASKEGFIAGAKWMANQMPMPEDTVIFMKGVAEGRRLEREDREENKRKEDELPRFYGD